MVDLDERDRAVLAVMMDGRANPYLIREETDLDKGEVNTVLVRLGRAGYVEQVTRGLYEVTEKGREAMNDG
jgi:Mn-dependent DtxR family transcriptional regulator